LGKATRIGIASTIVILLMLGSTSQLNAMAIDSPESTENKYQNPMNDLTELSGSSPPPMEWNKTFGETKQDRAYSARKTDGGYIIVGSVYYETIYPVPWTFSDIWLVKTDGNGNWLWDKTWGDPDNYEEVTAFELTTDGGYIICARGQRRYDLVYYALLIKMGAGGNEQWSKTFDAAKGAPIYELNSVQQTPDGGYIVAGSHYFEGTTNQDLLLMKVSSAGNKVWEKTYNKYGGKEADIGYSIRRTTDGGYIVAGTVYAYNEIWLIKTDGSGNIQWDTTHKGGNDCSECSVQQTTDGGYIVTGSTHPLLTFEKPIEIDFLLIKTDAKGNVKWDKIWGTALDDYASSVRQTTDGGYIVAGSGLDLFNAYDVAVVTKVCAYGNTQWIGYYGEPADTDRARFVEETLDGGFIVAGSKRPYHVEDFDFWLVKLAKEELYPAYEEVVDHLKEVEANFPDIASLHKLGESVAGRAIYAIKISDNPDSNEENEMEILYMAAHHGNEMVTVPIAMRLIDKLAKGYSREPATKKLVEEREIWIIPLVNPDGYEKARDNFERYPRDAPKDTSAGNGRYNGNGVDLNRNYAENFMNPRIYYSQDADYNGVIQKVMQLANCGRAQAEQLISNYNDATRLNNQSMGRFAFSEPETQCMKSLAGDKVKVDRLDRSISFHSFGGEICFPWNYDNFRTTYKNANDESKFRDLANEMSSAMAEATGQGYNVSHPWFAGGYNVGGESDDWLYSTYGTYAFTIEVYGEEEGNPASPALCQGYYPTDKPTLEKVVKNNIAAALSLAGMKELMPEREVKVTTDKKQYALGEEVNISIANTGYETMMLSCDLPFSILNATGFEVYPGFHMMYILYIQPGEKWTYVWDQKDWGWGTGDRKQVPPGNHTVEVSTGPPRPSTTFEIITLWPLQWSNTYGGHGHAQFAQPIGDIDEDGVNEIIVGGYESLGSGRARILSYDATTDTYIEEYQWYVPGGTYHSPSGCCILDLDGDGDFEFVMSWAYSGSDGIYAYDWDGETLTTLGKYLCGFVFDVYACDYDDDDQVEVLIANAPWGPTDYHVVAFGWDKMTNNFVVETSWKLDGYEWECPMIWSGDIDGDKRTEVVACISDGGDATAGTWALNWDTTTRQWNEVLIYGALIAGGTHYGVSVGDVDGDGIHEIGIGNYVEQLVAGACLVEWNGTAYKKVWEGSWPGEYPIIEALAIGDADNDGKNEFCVGGGNVHVISWTGTQYIEESIIAETFGLLSGINIGDCNNDGLNELKACDILGFGPGNEWIFKYEGLRIHDIAVKSIVPYKTVVAENRTVAINVTVENQGNSEDTFSIILYIGNNIETQVLTLPGGELGVLTFEWNTTGIPLGNYTISAYAWPVPGETDVTDNSLTDGTVYVIIPGDLNGDGTVDIYDAIILANAYNSRPGAPNWNVAADINNDGTVDIYDAILLANNYGKTT